MIQWTDDAFGTVDSPERARRLQATHPGWTVWWGKASGHFNASHAHVPEIVQARTIAEMAERITAWQPATIQRGVGVPAPPGRGSAIPQAEWDPRRGRHSRDVRPPG